MPVHCHALLAATNVEKFGGKACNLARARQLGLTVPRTMVIDRRALQLFLSANGFEALVTDYLAAAVNSTSAEWNERYRRLIDTIRRGSIPDALRRDIGQVAAEMLTASPCGLAIRSTAVREDTRRASFAGVFESYVGVMTADDVLEKMVSCWCSNWSPKAVRYMAQMELEPSTDGMAVMIQEVIPATCSGVIYTADPASGDPWQFVLQATRGLSIDLMSGSGAGDRYRLDWETGTIREKEIVNKPAPLYATPNGVRTKDDDATNGREPSISEDDATVVAGLARALDDAFDMRLDIEWAITPDGPVILQVRPMTALPTFFPAELTEDQQNRTWEPALVVLPLRPDHPPNFLTPLYRHDSESEMWYRYQPGDIILTGIWKCELDLNGYRYGESGPRPTFEDFFDNPGQYEAWLVANEPRYRPRWDHRLDELRGLAESAQSGIRETTQAADLVPVMLDVMDRLWDLNSFGWSGPQALGWMCEAALTHFLAAQNANVEAATLLCSDSDSYTYQVTENEQALGRSIDEPVVAEALERLPLGEIVPHLMSAAPHSTFLGELESFCWRFGKTPPSWLGRPLFWSASANDVQIVSAIKSAWLGKSKDVRTLQAESMKKCRERGSGLRARLAAAGQGIIERFDRLLEWARYWGQALNDRHGLLAGLLWERECVWRVGTRLQREGMIEAPIDVLVFERGDLEKLAGQGSAESVTRVYQERRRIYRRNRRLVSPAIIGAPPPAAAEPEPSHAESESESETVQPDGEGSSFTGRGLGGGSATGRARVIMNLLDPEVLDSLGSDDVLVLPHETAFHYADWHSVLTIIKGVVSPGRPSHHLAQVARECGVPLIGHVTGDLTTIADGATIRIDGASGAVFVL